MQTVVHVAHHVDPKIVELFESALWVGAALFGSSILAMFVGKVCSCRCPKK